jgi:hypothetical protein
MHDSVDVARSLLKAAMDASELVQCIHKFAIWWDLAVNATSDLEQLAKSAHDLTISTERIDDVLMSWEDVQKNYRDYKTSVSTIGSFYDA